MKATQKFMRLAVALSLVSIIFCSVQIKPGFAESNGAFVAGQIVIKLNPANLVPVEQINASFGTTTIKPLLNDPLVYLLQVPNGSDPAALAEQMALDTRLLLAEPNFIGQILEGVGRSKWAWGGMSPDPMGEQYAAQMLQLPQAHAQSTGDNTVVAVLDTGIQLDHPAYASSLTTARWDFVDNDSIPDENFAAFDTNGDGAPESLAGHGTHVVEIVHMTAPGALIMPLRVLDGNGFGDEFRVAEAIQFAVQNGATIINLSLGTSDKSDLLHHIAGQVTEENNILIVAAAGNGSTKQKQWPAADSYVVAVTAVNAKGQRADFANFGSWVDVAAPGDQIFSAFPLNGYAIWSGTSMAAPFVAGQAALIRSKFPNLSAKKVEDRILDSATPLDKESGEGLINLLASLR